MKTRLWYVDLSEPRPIHVWADDPSWPNYDDNGRKIYDNTHFQSLDEAWDRLLAKAKAALEMAERDVDQKRKDYTDARHYLRRAVWFFNVVNGEHEAWISQGQEDPFPSELCTFPKDACSCATAREHLLCEEVRRLLKRTSEQDEILTAMRKSSLPPE